MSIPSAFDAAIVIWMGPLTAVSSSGVPLIRPFPSWLRPGGNEVAAKIVGKGFGEISIW